MVVIYSVSKQRWGWTGGGRRRENLATLEIGAHLAGGGCEWRAWKVGVVLAGAEEVVLGGRST